MKKIKQDAKRFDVFLLNKWDFQFTFSRTMLPA